MSTFDSLDKAVFKPVQVMLNNLSVCQLNWSHYCSIKRKMDPPKFVPAEWVKQELEKPELERSPNLK